MGPVLYLVSLIWIFYLALEPYVRRIWPETVISWSRMLGGKWIDPLVGRDVLAGATVGLMTTLLSLLEFQLPLWLGPKVMPMPLPSITSVWMMLNATQNLSAFVQTGIAALYFGLILLLFLVLVRMASRRRWVAAVAFVVIFAVATAHYPVEGTRLGAANWLSLLVQGVLGLVLLGLLTRHGLVAVIFCLLVRSLLMDFPVTSNLSVWYANVSLLAVGAVVAILAVGAYASLVRPGHGHQK